jgi:hypothetical protein
MIRWLLTALFATLCSLVPAHAQSGRWQVATDINNALSPNAAYIQSYSGDFPIWMGIISVDGGVDVIIQVKNPGCYCADTAHMEEFVRVATGSTDRDGIDGLLGVMRGGSFGQMIRLRRVRLEPGDDQFYEFRARLDNSELAAFMAGSRYMVQLGQHTFHFNGQGSAQAIQRIRGGQQARREPVQRADPSAERWAPHWTYNGSSRGADDRQNPAQAMYWTSNESGIDLSCGERGIVFSLGEVSLIPARARAILTSGNLRFEAPTAWAPDDYSAFETIQFVIPYGSPVLANLPANGFTISFRNGERNRASASPVLTRLLNACRSR